MSIPQCGDDSGKLKFSEGGVDDGKGCVVLVKLKSSGPRMPISWGPVRGLWELPEGNDIG